MNMLVRFDHGLGDNAYFAHLLQLYRRRGIDVEVLCTPDKRILYQAAGVRTEDSGSAVVHPWQHSSQFPVEGHGRFGEGSKMGHNISQPPLPDIGDRSLLWQEYCDCRIDIEPHLPDEAKETARRWLARLPRPVVLLHSKGNTAQEQKSLPDPMVAQFYRAYLDACDGSLILLDWDNRVPRLASYRVRHLDELGPCPTEVLMALLTQADLLVGVDSGPLHVARFTHIPTIGVWMPGHNPWTFTLPRREQVNLGLVRTHAAAEQV
jgi:hypothetical protein